MGITQKLKTAVNLLKQAIQQYEVLTRKNKCIPSTGKSKTKKPTRKRGVSNAKNQTKNSNKLSNSKKVNFVEPLEPLEPIEPEEQRNPFEEPEELQEPEEEVREVNPMDDGLTKSNP
jgi:hypothetical protein